MNKGGLERAVATAMRVDLGSWKSLGAHLVPDWGMPTIGRVVLWTRFGVGCEVLFANGLWSQGLGIKTDMGKHTFEKITEWQW